MNKEFVEAGGWGLINVSTNPNEEILVPAPIGGRKDDAGKPRMELIPAGPLIELAKVYTTGAAKYSDYNWAKGIKFGRVFGAMMRHAWKFWRGEEFDPEDKQHHLDSVAWCAFTLRYYCLHHEKYDQFDDRYKEVS